MSEWQKQKISAFCDITRGGSPRPIQDYLSSSGTPWVKISDATASNNRYIASTKEFIKVEGESKSRVVNPGDFILSNSATPGLPRFMKIRACVHDGWLLIRNIKGVDELFLYYLLLTEREALLVQGNGSIFTNLKTEILKEHIVNLPPLEEQKAIASVLSSLDDKIDLFHRQNTTLERMAEALFRQWFVEEAQEDWDEYKVSDFAEHLKQSVNPAQSPFVEYHHYSLPAFDESQRPVLELGSEILSNKYRVLENTILVSKLNPRFPRIWAILNLPSTNSVCSTEFQVFKPKQDSLYAYLYFLFGSSQARDALEMAASGTSGSHQRVRPEDMLNITTQLPSISKAIEFSEITQPYIDKITANRKQIQTLEKLRDNLLPKLMSGEVKASCD